jgi:integrase
LAIPQGNNPHRPALGATTKVEPIRDVKAIKRIKLLLAEQPRNLCLFTLGINTAYRAGELLSIKVSQVDYLRPGDQLEIKQSKVKKYRGTPLNAVVISTIDQWLTLRPATDSPYLFSSQRANVLSVPVVNNLVKTWCRHAGLHGNYGSHSLRKTWGYHQRTQRHAPVPLLMEAFGHSSQRQTLDYLGVQAEEISNLYSLEL